MLHKVQNNKSWSFPQGQGASIRLLKRSEDLNTVSLQKTSSKVFIHLHTTVCLPHFSVCAYRCVCSTECVVVVRMESAASDPVTSLTLVRLRR